MSKKEVVEIHHHHYYPVYIHYTDYPYRIGYPYPWHSIVPIDQTPRITWTNTTGGTSTTWTK